MLKQGSTKCNQRKNIKLFYIDPFLDFEIFALCIFEWDFNKGLYCSNLFTLKSLTVLLAADKYFKALKLASYKNSNSLLICWWKIRKRSIKCFETSLSFLKKPICFSIFPWTLIKFLCLGFKSTCSNKNIFVWKIKSNSSKRHSIETNWQCQNSDATSNFIMIHHATSTHLILSRNDALVQFIIGTVNNVRPLQTKRVFF